MTAFQEFALAQSGPQDLPAAQQSLQEGCTLSANGEACGTLANFIFAGVFEGTVEDSISLWEKSCELGYGMACQSLARKSILLRPQYEVSRNVSAALERSCQRGDEVVCGIVVGALRETETFAQYPERCANGQVDY